MQKPTEFGLRIIKTNLVNTLTTAQRTPFIGAKTIRQCVTKINDLALHEAPLEFFDRISIHNNLFLQVPYTVVGLTRKEGAFSVIIEQPFIIAERGLEYEEVAAYMKQLGFEDMGKTYVNDTYIIDDLHPGNILKTPQGNIIVIDDVACLNTEDEDFDGFQKYGELF